MNKNLEAKVSRFFLVGILMYMQYGSYCNANETLEKNKQALDIIADFADRFCKEVPLKGSGSNLEISGEGRAELNGLISKLANLGIDGAAKYQSGEYQGLLQNDLLEGIKSGTNCRLQVWGDLNGRLLTSQPDIKPRLNQNITGVNISGDWEADVVAYGKKRHWRFTFDTIGDELYGSAYTWKTYSPQIHDGRIKGDYIIFKTVWRSRSSSDPTLIRDVWTTYRGKVSESSIDFTMQDDDGHAPMKFRATRNTQ